MESDCKNSSTSSISVTKTLGKQRGRGSKAHLKLSGDLMDMDKVEQVDSRLSTHEEVCALRYEAINARLKRLEGILMASAGAIILLLLSIVLK